MVNLLFLFGGMLTKNRDFRTVNGIQVGGGQKNPRELIGRSKPTREKYDVLYVAAEFLTFRHLELEKL